MKLSIFKQRNKETPNWVKSTVTEPTTFNELATLITTEWYSGAIYKNNHATNKNFISSQFVILDYDNNPNEPQLSLAQAIEAFADYKCIIAPTRSHRIAKGDKPVADRFRVILFLSEPITNEADFYATWQWVSDKFPGVDTATKDPARRIFPSTSVVFQNQDGELITPVAGVTNAVVSAPNAIVVVTGERGRLSSKTLEFMAQEASSDGWHNRFVAAAFDLKKKGYTQEEAAAKLTKASPVGQLDSEDDNQLEDVFTNRPLRPYGNHQAQPIGGVSSVESWVRDQLSLRGITVNYKTGSIMQAGQHTTPDALVSRLVLDAIAHASTTVVIDSNGKERRAAPHKEANIKHVLGLWLLEQDATTVTQYQRLVAFDSLAPNDQLGRWVMAVTGQTMPMDVAVMGHFVWQVKRKLMGLPVVWHMMPIVYGESGSGKSQAIQRLLSPINELTVAPQDMGVFGDSREARIFTRSYVAFFDEMAKSEKVDVGALKNKISCDTVTYRALYSNYQTTQNNTCTFIGATNHPIQNLIYDPTSARRFWQINSLVRCDWDAINDIDYSAIWTSIDEAADSPIVPFLDQVMSVQKQELRAKSLVEQWLMGRMAKDEGARMRGNDAYDLFKTWCHWQGMSGVGTNLRFLGDLGRMGYRVRTNVANCYMLRELPADAKDGAANS
jgi:hypothetical protein